MKNRTIVFVVILFCLPVFSTNSGVLLISDIDGSKIGELETEAEVLVVKSDGKWLLVETNVTGWILAKLIEDGQVNATDGAILRHTPALSSNPITKVPSNTTVDILDKQGEWRLVEASSTGWSKKNSLKYETSSVTGANFRARPGRGKLITKLPVDTKVDLLYTKGSWALIKAPLIGWAHKRDMANGKVSATKGLQLKGSKKDGKTITTIPHNSNVHIIEKSGDWSKIRTYKTGWVTSILIKAYVPDKYTSTYSLSYAAYYKMSGGKVEGRSGNQSLVNGRLQSLLGASLELNIDHQYVHHLQYSLSFDYSKFVKLKGLKMPAGYDLSFEASYYHLYKMISPTFKLSFESLVAPGRAVDPVELEWINIMFSLQTIWVGLGFSADFNFYKHFKVIFRPSYLHSLSATPDGIDYELSGSSSGSKINLLGELIYKNRYHIKGGISYYSLKGDSQITYNEFVLKVGMSF